MERKKRDLSVVLGTYNRKRFLVQTIESIRADLNDSELNHEIIVVDGGSTDGTIAWLTRQKDVVLVVQHNHGTWRGHAIPNRTWGYFMNLGFKVTAGRYICMLSDDCLVIPGAIRNGFNQFEGLRTSGTKVGALAFCWRNWPVDDVYFAGLTLGGNMFVNHGMFLRSALEEVGYIDEETFRFYCADGDLCLKLKSRGFDCVIAENSFVEHFFHSNPRARKVNSDKARADRQAYLMKWAGVYEDEGVVNRVERAHEDSYQTYRMFFRALGPAERKLLLTYYFGKKWRGIKSWVKTRTRRADI